MKHIIILIIAILLISCKNKSPNEFNLDIKLNGNYSGYLYLNYDKIKDSCLIKEGKAFFSGTVLNPTMAYYSTSNVSANDKNFYLENENIYSEITFSKRRIGEYNIDWITTNEISGTKSSIIIKDFEDFKLKFGSDENWNKKLFDELKKIIKQNPKHRYSGDLLSEICNDSILSKEQITELYYMLNSEFQDEFQIKLIESKAFPEYIIKVGDSIFDFDLPNKVNSLISTKNFRGQILFIDFWASWCKPCRAQFPELTQVNNDFREKGLTILGVSIDEKESDWLKALELEKPKWKNVIDNEGLTGKLSKKYGVFAIPYNVLVNKKGKIIATNISLEQLRRTLDSLVVNKKAIINDL